MLIEYGNTVVLPTWELSEEVPTGYSRVYYVHTGEVTYEAADGRRPLKPGCLYALPSTVPYRVWRNREKDFSCTYLHVDFSKYRVNALIELAVEPDSCLDLFVRTVAEAIREERIELLEQLADSFSCFFRESEAFVPNSQMLNRVQSHIQRHISEDLTIEKLSRLFSYHPNYFIRLFRRETGYTPYQYIVQQRMQYAVTQLNKGLPNEEVCYACGYTDSSTFTRAFRKYYGVAPQQYRKGHRKP